MKNVSDPFRSWCVRVCVLAGVVFGVHGGVLHAETVLGDFNGDGVFDQRDVDEFAVAFYDPNAYRIQHDGMTERDLLEVGDFNEDGAFNQFDARLFRTSLYRIAELRVESVPDFNGDGKVDSADQKSRGQAQLLARREARKQYRVALGNAKSLAMIARKKRVADHPPDNPVTPDTPTDRDPTPDTPDIDPGDQDGGGDTKPPSDQPDTDPSVEPEEPPLGYKGETIGQIDPNGWTKITPASDTRIIYVSSRGGDDENDGRTPDSPVKTLDHAYGLLRPGYPDWVLLKRGDVWDEGFTAWWGKSGRGVDEPMVISGYGSGPRPQIRPGERGGIRFAPNRNVDPGVSHIALIGIDLYADRRDPDSPTYDPDFAKDAVNVGIYFLSPGENLLIEGCRVRFFKNNINLMKPGWSDDGTLENVRVRRNVLTDSYSRFSHSQGLYARLVEGLLLEDNLFNHNGWNDSVAGGGPTVFNHNMYLSECRVVTARGNIIAQAAALGLKIRSDHPGGSADFLIVDNLFIHDAHGIAVHGNSSDPLLHTDFEISGNVMVAMGREIKGAYLSQGVELQSVKGVTVDGNFFLHRPSQLGNSPVVVEKHPQSDLTIRRNVIHDWPMQNPSKPLIEDQTESSPGVQIKGNYIELPGLRYFDPTRTVESYLATLGAGSTIDDFLTQAENQTPDHWVGTYTASGVNRYIRSGFSLVPYFD